MTEESVFAGALSLCPEERGTFLGQACAGRPQLRAAVEALLAAHEKPHNVLDRRPAGLGQTVDAKPVETDHSTPADGATDLPYLPGYRVLGEIARGGMGCVLAAHDLGLDRDVALKILLPGANAERFVRESKITARLPHPGIPPVHALGTLADGSPFLAMKLIVGQTLAAEMKTADWAARPRLLQAFTQVCQAVGFAHSRGVIHRDLKPANVMIGAFGEVQVMDWGLAKELTSREAVDQPRAAEVQTASIAGTDADQTTDHCAPGESTDGRTQAGAVMGTPAYMAPEQARGETTDARSDVFALGGILCAILTGQPPFSGKSALETMQRAGAGDLAEAHARLDGCGADAELVALCRRCLSANPVDRPADGQAVADGLTAYLNGVQERLQTAQRERAVALAREAEQRKRRKVKLALAATVVALLLGGVAFVWWRNVQVQAGRERDTRTDEAVATHLGQGEQALRANDTARARVALEAARKRFNKGGAEKQSERLKQLEADLALLRALDEVDQYRWTWVTDHFPKPAAAAAQAREALGKFGADPDAVSVDDAEARVSTSVVRHRIIRALDRLLWHQPSAGVRAVLRRVDADPYRDAVRDAALAKDRNKKIQELAGQKTALEQPTGFICFLGELKVISLERRRDLLRAAVSRSPGDLGLLMTLLLTYPFKEKESVDERWHWCQAAAAAAPDNFAARTNLGGILAEKKDYDGALACYGKAIELDPMNAQGHSNLGTALYGKGDLDGAIDSFRKAIELNPKLAIARCNLGTTLQDQGDVDGAIEQFRKAIELDSEYASRAHTKLGVALKAKGDLDEAIEQFRKAIELDPEDARAHDWLGVGLRAKGDLDGAIEQFRQSIELDPAYDTAHFNLGLALKAKGDLAGAIEQFRKAIVLRPDGSKAYANLGVALKDQGDLDGAIDNLRKALTINPESAWAHGGLGRALKDQGDLDGAIEQFRKVIELDPKNGVAYGNLGLALKDNGDLDGAIHSTRKAVELAPKDAWVHDTLGYVLMVKGELDEASDHFRKAIRLDPKYRKASANLARAERIAAVQGKLPALLKGDYQPKANDERLALADLCILRRLYRASAGLYADAFAADPRLTDDLKAAHRYNAARSAALAGTGQGEDAAGLDATEKARLRQRSLDWLRADLVLRTRQLESGKPADRDEVQEKLKYWQGARNLAGIRDEDALAKLPVEERAACAKLWADVAALLKKAGEQAR